MDNKKHLEIAKKLARLLEIEFSLWKFKFGIDPILGIVPGLGDLTASILSFYLIYVAVIHKVPSNRIAQMIFNIALDFVIGSIPLIGDLLDFGLKPNTKNLAILEKYQQNGQM